MIKSNPSPKSLYNHALGFSPGTNKKKIEEKGNSLNADVVRIWENPPACSCRGRPVISNVFRSSFNTPEGQTRPKILLSFDAYILSRFIKLAIKTQF